MDGKNAPNAWVELPKDDQDELVQQAQWCRRVRDPSAAEERLYNKILLKLGVDQHPDYKASYRDYIPVNSDPDHAGTMDFVAGLHYLLRQNPNNANLQALLDSIASIHDTAMALAAPEHSQHTGWTR